MSDNPTTETKKGSRVRRTSEAARSGLDVMLSDAASGGPPRFIAPGSAVKIGAGLARRPQRVDRPRRRPWRRTGPRGDRPLGARARQRRPAFRRPRVGGQLAVPRAAPELPGDRRHRRRTDLRCRGRLARRAARAACGRERPRRGRPDQLRLVQSDGDQGGRRHRRRQPRPRRAALHARSEHAVATAGDRRHEQVRGWRQCRGHARIDRAPDRRVRADPVPADDRSGAGGADAVHPADDQQVLRARHLAGTEHDRALRRPGTAGVRDLVAQP